LQKKRKKTLVKLKNNALGLIKKEKLGHVQKEKTTEVKILKLKKVIHSKISLEKKLLIKKTSKNLGSLNTIIKTLKISVKKMSKNQGTIIKIIKKSITIPTKIEVKMVIKILEIGIANQNLNLMEL